MLLAGAMVFQKVVAASGAVAVVAVAFIIYFTLTRL
jgi:hypothetical protein